MRRGLRWVLRFPILILVTLVTPFFWLMDFAFDDKLDFENPTDYFGGWKP